MEAKEATKKLGEIFDNLTDDQQKEAIRIAIRAIDQLDRWKRLSYDYITVKRSHRCCR